MNWKLLINELSAKNLTVQRIAEETQTKRTTISSLKTGQNAEPYWSRGQKLIELHRTHCPDSKLLNP